MMKNNKFRPGDLACSYMQYYINKPFHESENHIRWIPLYLTNMKLCVCVCKDNPKYELVITKYHRSTMIPDNLDKNIVIINNDENSIIYIKSSNILDIIYLLVQTFQLTIQPLSMNPRMITFSKFQKEHEKKSSIVHSYKFTDNVPVYLWLIILSNIKIESKNMNEFVNINEF